MSAKPVTCLLIECDVCGGGAEHDDYTPHFETIEQAAESLGGDDVESEWLMTAAEHVCPKCRSKRACQTIGHDWADWININARGIPMSVRSCWRCSERETAPTPTPTEEPDHA